MRHLISLWKPALAKMEPGTRGSSTWWGSSLEEVGRSSRSKATAPSSHTSLAQFARGYIRNPRRKFKQTKKQEREETIFVTLPSRDVNTGAHTMQKLIHKSMNTYTNTPTHALEDIRRNWSFNYAVTGLRWSNLIKVLNLTGSECF